MIQVDADPRVLARTNLVRAVRRRELAAASWPGRHRRSAPPSVSSAWPGPADRRRTIRLVGSPLGSRTRTARNEVHFRRAAPGREATTCGLGRAYPFGLVTCALQILVQRALPSVLGTSLVRSSRSAPVPSNAEKRTNHADRRLARGRDDSKTVDTPRERSPHVVSRARSTTPDRSRSHGPVDASMFDQFVSRASCRLGRPRSGSSDAGLQVRKYAWPVPRPPPRAVPSSSSRTTAGPTGWLPSVNVQEVRHSGGFGLLSSSLASSCDRLRPASGSCRESDRSWFALDLGRRDPRRRPQALPDGSRARAPARRRHRARTARQAERERSSRQEPRAHFREVSGVVAARRRSPRTRPGSWFPNGGAQGLHVPETKVVNVASTRWLEEPRRKPASRRRHAEEVVGAVLELGRRNPDRARLPK